jgi:hypothetical protein
MQCESCRQTLEPDAPIYRVARWDFGAFVSEVCATCCATKPQPDHAWMKDHQWRTPAPCERCGRPVIQDLRRNRRSTSPVAASVSRRSIRRSTGRTVEASSLSPASCAKRRSRPRGPTPDIVRGHAGRRLTDEGLLPRHRVTVGGESGVNARVVRRVKHSSNELVLVESVRRQIGPRRTANSASTSGVASSTIMRSPVASRLQCARPFAFISMRQTDKPKR